MGTPRTCTPQDFVARWNVQEAIGMTYSHHVSKLNENLQ